MLPAKKPSVLSASRETSGWQAKLQRQRIDHSGMHHRLVTVVPFVLVVGVRLAANVMTDHAVLYPGLTDTATADQGVALVLHQGDLTETEITVHRGDDDQDLEVLLMIETALIATFLLQVAGGMMNVTETEIMIVIENETGIGTESATVTEIVTTIVTVDELVNMRNHLTRKLTVTFPATVDWQRGERHPWDQALDPNLVVAAAGERGQSREADFRNRGKWTCMQPPFTHGNLTQYCSCSVKPKAPLPPPPPKPVDLPKPKLQFANLKWKPDNSK